MPPGEESAPSGADSIVSRMISRVLASKLEVEEVLKLAVGLMVEATGAERGFLVLLDGEGAHEFRAAVHLRDETIELPEFEVSRTLVEQVAHGGSPVLIEDALDLVDSIPRASVERTRLRSALVVPVPRPEAAVAMGVLYLDDRRRPGRFGTAEANLVTSFVSGVARLLENSRIQRSVSALAGPAVSDRFGGLIGRSPAMRGIFGLLARVGPTDLPVLVEGESGTGKELVARALHQTSLRARGPLVAVECAALAESLFEAELFGVVRGAFTGAENDREGILARAHGGTLFLDEVSEMSPALQAKLLRALEGREIRPVGGDRTRRIDFRVVSATHQNLAVLCRDGKFRADLFFRLSAVRVHLPPLRERSEDIGLLAEHFLAEGTSGPPAVLTKRALERLGSYPFPGNVRELRHILEKARVLFPGGEIGPEAIRLDPVTPSADRGWQPLAEDEREALLGKHPDLSMRDIQILGLVRSSPGSEAREVARALSASRATVLRSLGRLAGKGLVRKVGGGRSVSYLPG